MNSSEKFTTLTSPLHFLGRVRYWLVLRSRRSRGCGGRDPYFRPRADYQLPGYHNLFSASYSLPDHDIFTLPLP